MFPTDEMVTYLGELGVNGPINDRFNLARDIVVQLTSQDIIDIFICDLAAAEGRVLQSAWFFTEDFVLEAKNFQFTLNVDILGVNNNVEYLNVFPENYLLDDYANERSRLRCILTFSNGQNAELTATGSNCLSLSRVLRDRFLPHMTVGRPS